MEITNEYTAYQYVCEDGMNLRFVHPELQTFNVLESALLNNKESIKYVSDSKRYEFDKDPWRRRFTYQCLYLNCLADSLDESFYNYFNWGEYDGLLKVFPNNVMLLNLIDACKIEQTNLIKERENQEEKWKKEAEEKEAKRKKEIELRNIIEEKVKISKIEKSIFFKLKRFLFSNK